MKENSQSITPTYFFATLRDSNTILCTNSQTLYTEGLERLRRRLILGQLDSDAEAISRVHSVDIGTVSAAEDIRKLVYQDFLGVRPTELCTCSENALREKKFVKALSASTTLVSERVQVRMPWKETGPPKQSNCDIALKRMYSANKSFKKKDCLAIVDEEVQKLVDQSFVIKVPPENVDHSQQEW